MGNLKVSRGLEMDLKPVAKFSVWRKRIKCLQGEQRLMQSFTTRWQHVLCPVSISFFFFACFCSRCSMSVGQEVSFSLVSGLCLKEGFKIKCFLVSEADEALNRKLMKGRANCITDPRLFPLPLSLQYKVVGQRGNGDAVSSPTDTTPTQENPSF